MKILALSCNHGEWASILELYNQYEKEGVIIDLILITGDTHAFRRRSELKSFKHNRRSSSRYQMGSFINFFNGTMKMPCLTLVIGGNNESCNFFGQLPYGGWIAENIYYLGWASQVKVGELIITGISGVYYPMYYYRRIFESFPIRHEQIKTSISLRAFSDFQALCLNSSHIVMTHDWPSGIPKEFGIEKQNNPKMSILIDSDNHNEFGHPLGLEIMKRLSPQYYLSGHHHIDFDIQIGTTQFYGLGRFQSAATHRLIDMPYSIGPLQYTGEWIEILKKTKDFMSNPEKIEEINSSSSQFKGQLIPSEDIPIAPFSPELIIDSEPLNQTLKFIQKHDLYYPHSLFLKK